MLQKKIKLYLSSTGLYNIPPNWHSEKIGALIEDLKSGFASGLRDDRGIIQLRMNNISSDGRLVFDDLLKVPIPHDIENFRLQPDDVILNNTNSLDLIGKAAMVREHISYTFSNHLTRIRINKNKITPAWLFHILLRYRERNVFRSICNTHVGQSGIGKSELQNLLIFFPTIVEQERITSILFKVDELIQKTGQIIEQTQNLKKGLMQKLLTKGIHHINYKNVNFNLGKTINIPESWTVVRIRDTIEDVQSGFASGERDENGIIQLRMNNITDDGNFDFSKLLKVPIPADIKKYDIRKNDVLFNNTNSLDLIGKAVIVSSNLEYTFSNHITRLRTKNDMNPYFLFLILLKYKREYVFRSICNTHVGQSGIGKNDLIDLLICHPDLDEQNKIADFILKLNSEISLERKNKVNLENLKRGLMQNLLTGKIRVKI